MLSTLRQFILKHTSEARKSSPEPAPPLNPGVRVVDGKIIPHYACQTDVVSHCNLACRDCDHISPMAAKKFADPDTLFRDFSTLAKVYQPRLVQLLGGEPLLHPEIVPVLQAIRASGISDRLMVVTNGVLLSRTKDSFWENINDLEISIYPGFQPDQKQLQAYKDKARDFNVRLEIYWFKEFRRVFSLQTAQDPALVRKIYRNCKKVHMWGCHSVYEGYLYRCPQSHFIPKLLGLEAGEHTRDGLKLHDGAGFREELFDFLTSPEPLKACWNCLATAGIMRPHIQVRPTEWLSHQSDPWESLVDHEELSRIEAEMHLQKPDHIKELIERQGAA